MDEMIGLIMGYYMTHWLVDDATARSTVKDQVNNLGDYLSEHGYYLVRPCGGFAARGASGVLPAMEYPFSRVFQRITGNSYPIRNGFQTVMEKADVWGALGALEGPFHRFSALVGAGGLSMLMQFGAQIIEGVVRPWGLETLLTASGLLAPRHLERACSVRIHLSIPQESNAPTTP